MKVWLNCFSFVTKNSQLLKSVYKLKTSKDMEWSKGIVASEWGKDAEFQFGS